MNEKETKDMNQNHFIPVILSYPPQTIAVLSNLKKSTPKIWKHSTKNLKF